MKQLIELINFNFKNDEGSWQHVSSYHKGLIYGEKVNIFYHEEVEGYIETALVSPSEYWTKLKGVPFILKDLKQYELNLLKEIIGESSDIINLETDYALSVGNICYYLLYNFEYIEATLHIETLKVTVHKKDKYGKKVEYEMPKMDYISLVALIIEEFRKEDLGEYTKVYCTKCNHTYYSIGEVNKELDRCIYCRTSDNVIIAHDEEVNFKIG